MLRTSEQIAKILDTTLNPYAVKHSSGKLRKINEPADKFRTRFQLDRDRILHSKPFRRLKNKTQVFTPKTGDHFRDRLTHTLEVSQVARSLARNLGLNEDLSEVIALAHDLGHTPFGHAGEYALRDCLKPLQINFEHNEQSLYLVTPFNLNIEVLEGLQKHQTPYDQSQSEFINASLEAQIVNFADEIAYHNHDLDDGIRSGILDASDFTQLKIYQRITNQLSADFNPTKNRQIFISKIMKEMVEDLSQEASSRLEKNNIETLEDVYSYQGKLVDFSTEFKPLVQELRQYLYQNFYHHLSVTSQTDKGTQIIKALFDFYIKNPDKLPTEFRTGFETSSKPAIIIKDYISGMTDPFAESKYIEYALS
jgi:dGTPase